MKTRIENLAAELGVDPDVLRDVLTLWARFQRLTRYGPPAIPIVDESRYPAPDA